MSPLETYIRTIRFRAECDALEEAFGEVPESILECMKWGAICELAKGLADLPIQRGAETGKCDGLGLCFNISYTQHLEAAAWFGGRTSRTINPEPDSIFPHLEHLIESEATT